MASVYYDDGPGPRREIKMADRPLMSDKQRAPELDMRRRRCGVGGSTINGSVYTVDGFTQEESMIIASLQLDDHAGDTQFEELTEKGKKREAQTAMRYATVCRLKHKTSVVLYYADMAIHPSMRWIRASPDFVEKDSKWIVQIKYKSKHENEPVPLKHLPDCKGETFPCDCPYAGEYVNQVYLEMMAAGILQNHITIASKTDLKIFTCDWKHWKDEGGWWQGNKSWILRAYNWGLRWYWEDIRTEESLARVRSLIWRFNNRQRGLMLKDGIKRRMTDAEELFKLRPVEEDGDVAAVRAWRMRITPAERPLTQVSQGKRKHEDDSKHESVKTAAVIDASASAPASASAASPIEVPIEEPIAKRQKSEIAVVVVSAETLQDAKSTDGSKFACYRYCRNRCHECGAFACPEGHSERKIQTVHCPVTEHIHGKDTPGLAHWCPRHVSNAGVSLPAISLAFVKKARCGACGLTLSGIRPLDVLPLCDGCYKQYFNVERPAVSNSASATASK